MALDLVDGLPLSRKWLISLLKSVLSVDVEPISISAKPIDEGKGFLSLIAQLKFEWSANMDATVPRSLVMKVPNTAKLEAGLANSSVSDAISDFPFDGAMLEMAHNCECTLYRLFALSPGVKSPVTIGKIYALESASSHTSEMRYILMEDFVGRGRSPDFLTETLTHGQVNALVKEIAAMQAYGITHPNWYKQNKFMQFEVEQWKNLPNVIKSVQAGLRAQYPDILTATDEQIDSITDYAEALKVYEDYSKGRRTGVMTHGDLWSNNVLFARDEFHTKDKLLAVIDWQSVHPGSLTEDLARLLTSSVTPGLRRQYELEWLQLYYTELGNMLPWGVDIPFSFEDVMTGWKKSFAFAATTFIMHVGLVIGNSKATEGCTEQHKRNLVARIQQNIEDCL